MPTDTSTTRTATWNMTSIQLARVFAEHFGYSVKGNWIHSPAGVAVACGWEDFAAKLAARGWTRVGQGVNWRHAGESPRLPRATRTAQGYWR